MFLGFRKNRIIMETPDFYTGRSTSTLFYLTFKHYNNVTSIQYSLKPTVVTSR